MTFSGWFFADIITIQVSMADYKKISQVESQVSPSIRSNAIGFEITIAIVTWIVHSKFQHRQRALNERTHANNWYTQQHSSVHCQWLIDFEMHLLCQTTNPVHGNKTVRYARNSLTRIALHLTELFSWGKMKTKTQSTSINSAKMRAIAKRLPIEKIKRWHELLCIRLNSQRNS